MGYIEDIDKLELSDEVKAQLKAGYQAEVDPLKTERDSLKAKSRVETVEKEIADWGLSDTPGLAKHVRRILLSADAEEPGAILLSDSEMGLSGDQATGATGREEISVASAVRKIFELMPKNSEGKLNLSDQALEAGNVDRPAAGEDDPSEKSENARQRISKITGKSVQRSSTRYNKGGVA